MSVKELAAELGEPQTKLYRHVKQLESAGLIRVAASRLVSGILEQGYQACQTDLRLGPGLMRDEAAADDSAALVTVLLDQYRERFFAARAAAPGEDQPGPSFRRPVMTLATARVSQAKAAAIRDRLQEIIDKLISPTTTPRTACRSTCWSRSSARPGPLSRGQLLRSQVSWKRRPGRARLRRLCGGPCGRP